MTNLEAMEPVDDQVDHVRGPAGGRLILEYGDYECPYSRPHALAAAAAAEAAALQDRFWEMHVLLFHRQLELEGDDLQRHAAKLELDASRFNEDRSSRHRRQDRELVIAAPDRRVVTVPGR